MFVMATHPHPSAHVELASASKERVFNWAHTAHRPAVTPEELNAASSLCPPPPRFYTHLYSFNALSAWMDFLMPHYVNTWVIRTSSPRCRLRGASLLSEGCWCFWTPTLHPTPTSVGPLPCEIETVQWCFCLGDRGDFWDAVAEVSVLMNGDVEKGKN